MRELLRDRERLEHIAASAENIARYTKGKTYDDMQADDMMCYAVAYDGNLSDFIKQGKKIYIPMASFTVQQRYGAKKLRELLMEDGYWTIVGCEDEVDFILEYVFDDRGKDHAYLLFSDRFHKEIMYSHSVSADWFVPTRTAEESAEELYEKHIVKGIKNGKLKKYFEMTENDK